jgi:hypothetical protein
LLLWLKQALLLSLNCPGLICSANRPGKTTPENDANPASALRRVGFFFALSSLSELAALPKKETRSSSERVLAL